VALLSSSLSPAGSHQIDRLRKMSPRSSRLNDTWEAAEILTVPDTRTYVQSDISSAACALCTGHLRPSSPGCASGLHQDRPPIHLPETHGSMHLRNDRWPTMARSVLCIAVYYVCVRRRRCQGSACGCSPFEHGNRMHRTSLFTVGGRPTRRPQLGAASIWRASKRQQLDW